MMSGSKHKAGFSLVEISLAILVMAVGLTVVVALFPAGLGQSQIALEESQVGNFVEDVFNAIQAKAHTESRRSFISGLTSVPIARADVTQITINARTDNTIRTIKFKSSDGTFDDYVIRYRIKKSDAGHVLKITMEIWPGEWGATTAADAMTFYTEIYNTGL